MTTVALLISGTFEAEYGKRYGLDRDSYLKTYRNDWSWNYAFGLKSEGIEPIIYIPSLNYSGIYQTEDGLKVRFLALNEWYKWVSKFRFPPQRFKIGTYWQNLVNVVAFKDYLLLSINEDNIDVLYIQEYWSTRFDFLINNVKIPIIGADHGGNNSLAIKSHKQKSLPKAYKLQCQTLEELKTVESYTNNAILLPNGVDTDFYCPLPANHNYHHLNINTDKTILTVARADDRQKRTSDLLKALQKLDSSWSLQIAGVGKDIKYLQSLASKLNISERVHFLGFISDKSMLREKYRQCSIFALPSAWEGLPLAVLEAMSCECAVVSTDIRAFNNLVIHDTTGIKVPLGNPSALAKGIVKCYQDREFYGKQARKIIVDSYSKKKMFSQLTQIIKSCPDLKSNLFSKCNKK
jgi:glycosyltransferase involved in cell wall biosynthesis